MSTRNTDITKSVRKILTAAGGEVRLALELGISQFAVREWRYKGIPSKHWPHFIAKGISADDLYSIACKAEGKQPIKRRKQSA